MRGKALKSKRKKISSKKLLKKAITKQMKRKMRKMSRRAKKKLSKMKKSDKAKKYVAVILSTVRQAEQVCKSLMRKALGRLGSLRKNVHCRFNDAHRLIKRLGKSRKISNNRKFTKAVAGVMAAVASHMRPLVEILYQQMLARRRTPDILKRLRTSVAKILRRLVRQAFGLRRAITDAIISDRKLSKKSKSIPPSSSSSKTMKKLKSSISKMEKGDSKESMADTVARVISIVSQVFHSNVQDLLRVYRLRQATETKLELAESSCGKGKSSVDCVNAQVFRVLERMAARSNSLVRNINRILPPDLAAGKQKAAVPKAIKVNERLLKGIGGESVSKNDLKRKSATRVARVITAIARNLRLVVNRLKLAVIRKKLSKEIPKGKPIGNPLPKTATQSADTTSKAAAKATAAKAVAKVGGTMTLESLNDVMLSKIQKLEQWSRSLYQQTASNPKKAEPEAIKVDKLPSSSAQKSAKQAALALAAITRRLRIIDQRVDGKLQKKLAAGETPTEIKPEKKSKPDKKPSTAAKSQSPTSKKDKSQKKATASKKQPKDSKKEKAAKKSNKEPKEKKGKKKTKPAKGKSPSSKEKKNKKKPKVKPKVKPKAKPKAPGGHVINRDDMAAELVSQSRVLSETVRGMASKVDKAAKTGNIQPNSKSEAENVWINYMNERLKSAGSDANKEEAIHLPISVFIDSGYTSESIILSYCV